jgi:hypothetical protein
MDKYILNDRGEPEICNDVITWGRWFEANHTQRIVAKDELPNDVRVSTVFLGLDHQFGHGEPLIFETMIFGGAHDGYQERYATRAAAEHGHRVALALAAAQDHEATTEPTTR